MEISYYFECLTRLPKSEKTLQCIAIEIRRASFSFSESFHEDYKDTKSEKSKELWNKIEPILKRSFGVMEVDLTLVQIIPVAEPAAVPATVIVEESEQESINKVRGWVIVSLCIYGHAQTGLIVVGRL